MSDYERMNAAMNATPEQAAELTRVAASMAPSLPEFLLARIAEDEAAANHARWAMQGEWFTTAEDKVDEFVRRNSPARVLAECEAKRRVVAWHRLIDGLDTEDNPVRGCGNCIASGAESPYLIAGPCMTVRLLALPYADHPDYREEWRP